MIVKKIIFRGSCKNAVLQGFSLRNRKASAKLTKFCNRLFIFVFFTITWIATYWIASIVKCENLTSKYSSEFIGLELQTNMLGQANIIKVLDYSEKFARVYFKDEYGGNILEFRKENGTWILNKWVSTVWSKHGSADSFMWPYVR